MTEKKKKWDKKFSIEELYQNKNFVPPKEKNLETIFEEPRKAKDGAPILTSVRKYKRYLHFDPTEGKIHKRKLKAKKCIGNLKRGKNLRTRSATKKPKCKDISMYLMEAIGESSDSEMEVTFDKSADENCKGTDAKDTDVVHKGKGTNVIDKGAEVIHRGIDIIDKCTDANRKDNSNPNESVSNASKQSQDKINNIVKEDTETTQEPDASEKDKPDSKDEAEKAKSPTRSSCIVT